MGMDILGNLFSSDPLVKIMRLFLMNQDETFTLTEISNRTLSKDQSAKREIEILEQVGFVRPKTVVREVPGKDKAVKKIKTLAWEIDKTFHYLEPLYSLLIEYDTLKQNDVVSRFRPAGKIKLLVVSGVFIKDPEARADLLVVGDNLNRKKIEAAVKFFEAQLGKELQYAMFDTEEFVYRRDMYDKLLCDIFDGNHEVLISSSGLSTEALRNR
jgi:hypothetical protein